jgi:misacylated tRNA(Ala) deacylase
MTDVISQRDAYARTVEATVVRYDEAADGAIGVVLDRTVFYPGGGGQPADTGTLRSTGPSDASTDGSRGVTGIRRAGADLVHVLDPTSGPAPVVGDAVTAEIDWARRHLLMRTHTALHTLCGVVWRDYGALVTGGNMEPGSGRMDFEFERMSGDLVDEIERKVNDELAAARDIRVNVLPREQALAIPDLIRTKINLLPQGISEIRTIEIVGLDLQADGGTHVANTREVGRIRVTGYESKGRINKRIRLEIVDAPLG